MQFFSIKLVLFLLLSGLSLSEKDYQLRDEVGVLPDEVAVYWINPLSNSK